MRPPSGSRGACVYASLHVDRSVAAADAAGRGRTLRGGVGGALAQFVGEVTRYSYRCPPLPCGPMTTDRSRPDSGGWGTLPDGSSRGPLIATAPPILVWQWVWFAWSLSGGSHLAVRVERSGLVAHPGLEGMVMKSASSATKRAAQIAALEEKLKQLKAREQAVEARRRTLESRRRRKEDTRREDPGRGSGAGQGGARRDSRCGSAAVAGSGAGQGR